MIRSERLLVLLHHLRQNRFPVSAEALAQTLGVSVRTVYRDIETLRRQGANIVGEAGLGFVLRGRSGFALPPLMFDEHELEALVFGMRWVVGNADGSLAVAAKSALAKIQAVLPEHLSAVSAQQAIYPVSGCGGSYAEQETHMLDTIRHALRKQRKLLLDYEDMQGDTSRRTIWPLALAYFEQTRLLIAWCELRRDFRHFRPDRMHALALGDKYATPREALLDEWQRREGVDLRRFVAE